VIFESCARIWGSFVGEVPLEVFLNGAISYKVAALLFTGFCLIPLLVLSRKHAKTAQMGKIVFFTTVMLLHHGLWMVLVIFDSIRQLFTD
jgi:hypothetical protein